MAVGALICGILGIIGGFIPYVGYVTLILSILGIVLGVKARKECMATGQPSGMATAGLVLGIIGCAFSAIGVVCAICACIALTSSGLLG